MMMTMLMMHCVFNHNTGD